MPLYLYVKMEFFMCKPCATDRPLCYSSFCVPITI